MINLDNVCFTYKKNEVENVLHSLTYEFSRGDVYLLSGKNGAGKTTLIKLLLGFLKPTSGEIHMEKDLVVSYLPDYNGLYEDLSVIDNVIFRLSLYNVKFKQKQELFYHLLKITNLEGKQNEVVVNLSLGMKKKVACICTMMIEPDIYVLDEPTGGVDEESKIEIANIINSLETENNMIICISHDPIILEKVNGKHLVLEEGNLHALSI